MLNRTTVSLSTSLRSCSECHWSLLPWAGRKKWGRRSGCPRGGWLCRVGEGQHRASRNPGFLLSLFKGFKKSFPFCCCRSCSAPQVLFCGLAVKVQLLSCELLGTLNQISLDRGPGRATWLKTSVSEVGFGDVYWRNALCQPPSSVPEVTCSLSVPRSVRSKFQGHFL